MSDPIMGRTDRRTAGNGGEPHRTSAQRLTRAWRSLWAGRPELVIMMLAIAVRGPAVLFAKGFSMHDDHFCVIEPAQRWVRGLEPPSPTTVTKRNLIYVGAHLLVFRAMETMGWEDPQTKMYVVRALHALYSLLTVWFGMKLAAQFAPEAMRNAGLMLAVFWLFPYMSVRNLAEYVCVPPLVMATYGVARASSPAAGRAGFLAGVAAGGAFVLRYQTAAALVPLGLLLARRSRRGAAMFVIGSTVVAAVALGVIEWRVFGQPFVTPRRYFLHNVAYVRSYVTNPWFTYVGTLVAAFIPPSSLLLLWGFLRSMRRAREVFWPTVVFLAVHAAIPNKQERFILPVSALLVVGAMIGLAGWKPRRGAWGRVVRGLWVWFWVVNGLLLVLAVATYGKRSRVEAMRSLRAKGDVAALVVETPRASAPSLPLFYLGSWPQVYRLTGTTPVDSLRHEIESGGLPPDYVLFLGGEHLDERVRRVADSLGDLRAEAVIQPSLVDRILFALNPRHNVNQTTHIYRIVRRG